MAIFEVNSVEAGKIKLQVTVNADEFPVTVATNGDSVTVGEVREQLAADTPGINEAKAYNASGAEISNDTPLKDGEKVSFRSSGGTKL